MLLINVHYFSHCLSVRLICSAIFSTDLIQR